MEKNGFIAIRLDEFLKILDARSRVCIYKGEAKEDIIKFSVNAFELWADNEFIYDYGRYYVAGVVGTLNGVNIIITKERI